ncbi:MAG: peptide deformylase [Leptospiraceae bacterium]|nr:peptide deformylase [Leptospiraceae bacterium]
MAVRNVLRLGNPLLRQTSVPIEESEVKTKEFKKLIGDMFDTMRHENGIGLAAPQIGVLKRVAIIGIEEENERYPDAPKIKEEVVINPIIKPLAKNGEGYWEGCLSVPGMRGFVERPDKIQLEYYDMKWNHHKIIVEGFPAIVYQHEIDHLDGILYVDRLKSPKLFGFTEEVDTKGKELD